MKKTLFLGLVFVLSVGLVLAARPDFQAANVKNPVTGDAKNTVALPAKAIEVAPNVYYLGESVDEGRPIQGYAFVDYRKGYGKPGTSCGNGVCEPGENAAKCPADCGGSTVSSCYGFLARGAKWKTLESYLMNPNNSQMLDPDVTTAIVASGIGKWEAAAGANILGNGTWATEILEADTVSTDGKNEVYFGSISEPGAIAITIIWGVFGGPPSQRQLVEWDQVYDEFDYEWSTSGEAGKMDFDNIATHELGHSAGLDDLYTLECAEQTMYGYADYGETKKRTLEDGDMTGVRKLYS